MHENSKTNEFCFKNNRESTQKPKTQQNRLGFALKTGFSTL